MGNLIRIKPNDPAYNKAFKHGAMFALFVYAFMALVFHDPFLALGAVAGGAAMAVV